MVIEKSEKSWSEQPTRISYSVEVESYAYLMTDEHNLSEGVKNSCEAKNATLIKVIRYNKLGALTIGKTTVAFDSDVLMISNNGESMTADQIEQDWLRAHKTGDEKADSESNRGMGNVWIFGVMEKAVLWSGNNLAVIYSPTDERNYGKKVEASCKGTILYVELNEKGKELYTEEHCKEICNQFFFANGQKLTFNGKKIGHYNTMPKIEKETYWYKGFLYEVNTGLFPFRRATVLLKLTGTDVYHMLPIDEELEQSINMVKDIVFVATKGKYLNASRTALSYDGKRAFKEVVERENKRLVMQSINDSLAEIKVKSLVAIKTKTSEIHQACNEVYDFSETYKHFDEVIKEADTVKDVAKQVRTMNKFLEILNNSKTYATEIELIDYDEIYGDLKDEISAHIYTGIEEDDVRWWFNEFFSGIVTERESLKDNPRTPAEIFWYREPIGMQIDDGAFAEATVRDLLKIRKALEFDDLKEVFNYIEGVVIVIVVKDEAYAFTNVDQFKIDIEEVLDKGVKIKDLKKADEFEVDGYESEDEADEEPDEGESEESDDSEGSVDREYGIDEHPEPQFDADEGADECTSMRVEGGSLVEVDNPDVLQEIEEASEDGWGGTRVVSTPYIPFGASDEEVQTIMSDEPAIVYVPEEPTEDEHNELEDQLEAEGIDASDELDLSDREDETVRKIVLKRVPRQAFISKYVTTPTEKVIFEEEMEYYDCDVQIYECVTEGLEGTQIPMLVDNAKLKTFKSWVKRPGAFRERKLVSAYKLWHETIDMILKTVKLKEKAIPVMLLTSDTNIIAKKVAFTIGLSWEHTPGLTVAPTRKKFWLLRYALHELVHFRVDNHGAKFTNVENRFFKKLRDSEKFWYALDRIFRSPRRRKAKEDTENEEENDYDY